MQQRYLFGPGEVNGAVVDQILARTSASGTTAWYLTDKLGSVRDIVSSSGTKLDHVVYDSFGNIVTETSAANGDRFKFAGMAYDATTGQYYDRARWYGPETGLFLSEDLMGFAAGDVNLFRYAGNEPADGTDSSGTQCSSCGGGSTASLMEETGPEAQQTYSNPPNNTQTGAPGSPASEGEKPPKVPANALKPGATALSKPLIQPRGSTLSVAARK